jgi:hypothetical protein
MAQFVLGEGWSTDGTALPPWDGTGVPLPVDDTGWPVLPDGGGGGGPVTVSAVLSGPASAVLDSEVTVTVTVTPPTPEGQADASWFGTWRLIDVGGSVNISNPFTWVAGVGTWTFTADAANGWPVGTHSLQATMVPFDAAAFTPADSNVMPFEVTAVAGLAAQPADEGWDPEPHTVTEVQDYLSDHPDQTEYVLDRERTGKARVSLIGA